MAYEEKDFSSLLGTKGFSNKLLEAHFKLYNGYVKNTNALLEKLDTMEKGTPEHAELQRRFGWEWNGMRLHELYFENLSATPATFNGSLKQTIEKVYGNAEDWKKDFSAVGAMRGIGWVILAFDKESGELFNIWINEHDVGHLAGCVPLLVMDVFEHAFIMDYGMDRGSYLKAFIEAVDWDVVQKRFEAATKE